MLDNDLFGPSIPFKHRFQDWLVRVVLWVLLHTLACHSLKTTRRLARFFGAVVGFLSPSTCRLIEANLAIAFPEMTKQERKELRKRNLAFFMEFGMDFLSMLKERDWSRSRVVQHEIPAECRGKAVIWGLPHYGNWEVLSQHCCLQGFPAAAVVGDFNLPTLERIFSECRSRYGTKLIPYRGAARGMIAALHQGINIGILIDQNISPKHDGEFVEFFGLPAPVSLLPATLAIKENLPLGMIDCHKREDGIFEITWRNLPWNPQDFPDALSLTREILRQDEEIIREHPEQYLWCYKRWKYLPPDISPELREKFPYYSGRVSRWSR
jgi:lauroyl/myristoyl acyltransferase